MPKVKALIVSSEREKDSKVVLVPSDIYLFGWAEVQNKKQREVLKKKENLAAANQKR